MPRQSILSLGSIKSQHVDVRLSNPSNRFSPRFRPRAVTARARLWTSVSNNPRRSSGTARSRSRALKRASLSLAVIGGGEAVRAAYLAFSECTRPTRRPGVLRGCGAGAAAVASALGVEPTLAGEEPIGSDARCLPLVDPVDRYGTTY